MKPPEEIKLRKKIFDLIDDYRLAILEYDVQKRLPKAIDKKINELITQREQQAVDDALKIMYDKGYIDEATYKNLFWVRESSKTKTT